MIKVTATTSKNEAFLVSQSPAEAACGGTDGVQQAIKLITCPFATLLLFCVSTGVEVVVVVVVAFVLQLNTLRVTRFVRPHQVHCTG